MDPVATTLISALVAGATAGVTSAATTAVTDAYAALKGIITSGYGKATELLESIASLEKKPDSEGRRSTVAEELELAGALNDEALVSQAEALLAIIESSAGAQSIGLDWSDVKAARLKLGKIRVRGQSVGFRAARMEIAGAVEIGDLDVGERRGK
jgi:hypothetical protein